MLGNSRKIIINSIISMFSKFILIKSRFDQNIEENRKLHLLELGHHGGSDSLASDEVILDVEPCMEYNLDNADNFYDQPDVATGQSFTKELHLCFRNFENLKKSCFKVKECGP